MTDTILVRAIAIATGSAILLPGLPIPLIVLAAFEIFAAAKRRFARCAFPAPPSPAILR